MENDSVSKIIASKRILFVVSILSLYFLSGWPARMLFTGEGANEGGMIIIFLSPILATLGFVSIPVVFAIVIKLLKYPTLSSLSVWGISLITTAIGLGAFWIPVMMPGLLYKLRVHNFNVRPNLVSQSLDKNDKTYHFSLQLDNKTDKTYENVDVRVGTGFLYTLPAPNESFVWTANKTKPRRINIEPGINTITDSIFLGDCKENIELRENAVKLEVVLTYNPKNDHNTREYVKKDYILDPKVEGVDIAEYYSSICDWFLP